MVSQICYTLMNHLDLAPHYLGDKTGATTETHFIFMAGPNKLIVEHVRRKTRHLLYVYKNFPSSISVGLRKTESKNNKNLR